MKRGLALALALGLALACTRATEPTGPATPAVADAGEVAVSIDPSLVHEGRVIVETLIARAPQGRATIPGEVHASEAGEAQVTSLVSGRIASLEVKLGDPVKKGQIVALVESPDVGHAQADLLRARGRATLTSRALARQVDLEGQAATSKAAVDEARAEDAAARADLLAAKTMLRSLGAAEAGDSEVSASVVALRAPIDGVVTERTGVLGGPIGPSTPLFRIVSSDRRVVLARLPETSAVHPEEGTKVKLLARGTLGNGAVPCEGAVERNVGVVDSTRSIALRIRVDGACPELVPGRFVEVSFGEAVIAVAADAGADLYVSTAAIVDIRGVPSGFVALPGAVEGKFARRSVRTGTTSGDDTVVAAGLASGDRVVTRGALLLKGELLRGDLQ